MSTFFKSFLFAFIGVFGLNTAVMLLVYKGNLFESVAFELFIATSFVYLITLFPMIWFSAFKYLDKGPREPED